MKKIILLLMLFCSLTTSAETRMMVPFPAGGAFDVVARQFSKFTGNKIVVENVSGASGLIGHRQFARSAPNTLMVTSSSFYINLANKEIDLENYIIVSVFAESPSVLLASKNKNLSCSSIKDTSKKYFLGSAGLGHTSVFASFITEKYSNVTEVPYKGIPQAIIDLMSGQIDMVAGAAPTEIRPDLIPLANSSNRTVNGIPSLRECLGTEDSYQLQWILLASPGSDPEFVNRYNLLAQTFSKDSETVESFARRMITPVTADVNRSTRLVQSEIKNWQKILK